jgi:hypothetical protein
MIIFSHCTDHVLQSFADPLISSSLQKSSPQPTNPPHLMNGSAADFARLQEPGNGLVY